MEAVATVSFDVMEANELPHVELIGKNDPFVEISLDGASFAKTKVIRGGGANPLWNERFDVDIDRMSECLEFVVWDHERIGSNETVGAGSLNIANLRDKGDPIDSFIQLSDKRGHQAGSLHIIASIKYRHGYTPRPAVPEVKGVQGRSKMHFRIVEGQGFRGSLFWGNPLFVRVYMDGRVIGETEVVDQGATPTWNFETFVQKDIGDRIKFEVYKKDKLGPDEMVGLWEPEEINTGFTDQWVTVLNMHRAEAGKLHILFSNTRQGAVEEPLPPIPHAPSAAQQATQPRYCFGSPLFSMCGSRDPAPKPSNPPQHPPPHS